MTARTITGRRRFVRTRQGVRFGGGALTAVLVVLCMGGNGHADLIDSPEKAKAAQAACAAQLGQPATWTNAAGMTFALIPPGTFVMGLPDAGAANGDAPPRTVTLTQPFYMATTEVTREQWERVVGTQHSTYFLGAPRPINYITWYDVQKFVAALNKQEERKASAGYRLPTEAEWEYSARAGCATAYPGGATPADLAAVAWFLANAESTTHPVASKAANAFGLHDMLGNVWEWCGDFYDADYYRTGDDVDPQGPATRLHGYRAIRGGSIYFGPSACRLGNRAFYQGSRSDRHIGFRVVLPIAAPQPEQAE